MAGYKNVIVIGYGVVAKDVLETVFQNQSKYGYKTEYIEHEVYPFGVARKYAVANSLQYSVIEENVDLLRHLMEAAERGSTLIISANNNYLFPKGLIVKDGVSIINFHNALLPSYPGRNAPSWAIYNNEAKTGITWHYVSAEVDGGDIIAQRGVSLSPDIKAYELVAEQMTLAAEVFNTIFEDVITDKVDRIKQNAPQNRKIYKSYEVPNNGRIDISSNPEEIYRILRSVDYGKNDIFPLPIAELDGRQIQIKRYKVVDEIGLRDNRVYIPYKNKYLMLAYNIVEADSANKA